MAMQMIVPSKKDFNPFCHRQEMDTIRSIENVMGNTKVWMDTHRLKMNSSKWNSPYWDVAD